MARMSVESRNSFFQWGSVALIALTFAFGCGTRSSVATAPAADPLEIIPSNWIDLPTRRSSPG